MTPDQVLDDQNNRLVNPNTRERVYWSYLCVEYAKDSVMPDSHADGWRGNKMLGHRAKSQARYAVYSWFAYNDLDLKPVKSIRIEETDIEDLPPINLREFSKIVKLAPLKWACALMVLLQSAVRIGDFFDQVGLLWPMIKEQIDKKKCVIKINARGMEILHEVSWHEIGTKLVCLRLYGATTRGKTFHYMTFLGNDALDLLVRYVKERGEPAKGEKLWDCDKTRLQKKIHIWAIKAHLMQREKGNTKGGRRYKWHIHRLRKLFKTNCILRGVSEADSELYCLLGDTCIAGDFGSIKDITEGDHIIGSFMEDRVKQKYVRQYSGELLRIKAHGLLPINLTPEHPVQVATEWASRKNVWIAGRRTVRYSRHVTDPYWKSASEVSPFVERISRCKQIPSVRGDYLVIPRVKGHIESREFDLIKYVRECPRLGNKSRWMKNWVKKTGQGITSFPLNQETAWLLGLYVAEGSGNGKVGGRLNFRVGHLEQERDLIDKACRVIETNLNLRAGVAKAKTGTDINVYSAVLARAFKDWCGPNSWHKKIPRFIFYHASPSICWAFIQGYLAGDGSNELKRSEKGTNTSEISACTVSRKLALQLQLLFARLGKVLLVRYQRATGNPTTKPAYKMRHPIHQNRIFAYRVTKRAIFMRIKTVTKSEFSGNVYNIRTRRGSYLANNAIVHNCGHKPTGVDKIYDERHISHPEVFAAEYLKVEPCLNVLSNPEGKTAKTTELFIKRFEPTQAPLASSSGRIRRSGK